jgi:hypothetical protein
MSRFRGIVDNEPAAVSSEAGGIALIGQLRQLKGGVIFPQQVGATATFPDKSCWKSRH